VSPARARTSLEEIVAAGRALLESGGVDAITMQAVAERVGVRGPSLYKRIPSRAALIAAIAGDVLDELGRRLAPHTGLADPAVAIRAVAAEYRAFAHERPRAYELAWSHLSEAARPPVTVSVRAADPVIALMERVVGPDDALPAARLLTAFAHGFVSMELAGAFRLGGDVDVAYDFGVERLIDALLRAPQRGA
jgi:AcrR family transcriptional regulator